MKNIFDKSKYESEFVRRGEKIYKSREVHLKGVEDEVYSFYVYGSETYGVRINLKNNQNYCTCPWRDRNDYCKHEIAALLYLDDLLSDREPIESKIKLSEKTFQTVEECKTLISKTNRRYKKNGFIAYWDGYNWGDELTDLLYECEYDLENEEGLLAVQAVYLVLKNILANWYNIDDDGTLCPLLENSLELLVKGKEYIDDGLKKNIFDLFEKDDLTDAKSFAEDYLEDLKQNS